MQFELKEDDLKILEAVMDLALKTGGIKSLPAINHLVKVFGNPIKDQRVDGANNDPNNIEKKKA